jgi:hypothetical protein
VALRGCVRTKKSGTGVPRSQQETRPMRAEAQAMVNEIEESLALLRRRL